MRSPAGSLLAGIICCGLPLALVCFGCSRSTVMPDYSRTPVLFVHGHSHSSGSWKKMIAHLRERGYPSEYLRAVNIVDHMSNVRAATEVISAAADALLNAAAEGARRAGRGNATPARLDIVSHSMGAVSARWYASRLRPDRVRTFISLAGANHGTNSLCGFPDDGAAEMCPAFAATESDSMVQTALNGTNDSRRDETPFGLGIDRNGVDRVPPDALRNILYLTVRIEPDEWIAPVESALLDGAGGVGLPFSIELPARETSPGNYLFLQPTDHDALIDHPDLMNLVETMLAARDASDAASAFVKSSGV